MQLFDCHSFSHYGECVRKYGPPITYWTGRFESKHRIAKESFQIELSTIIIKRDG